MPSSDGSPDTTCRVCGSTTSVPYGLKSDRVRAEDPAQLFPLRRCLGDCGCLFVAYPEGWDVGRIYDDKGVYHVQRQSVGGYGPYADRFGHDLEVAGMRLERAASYLPVRGVTGSPWFMDVGCSNGALPCRFSDEGWNAFGCDASRYIIENAARGHFERRMIPASNAFVHNVDEAPFDGSLLGKFRLVQCNDVIEHSADPVTFARRLSGLLDGDGFLFVDTPDFGDPAFARLGMSFRHVKPVEHAVMLDEPALRWILAEAGLRTLDVYRPVPGKLVSVARKG